MRALSALVVVAICLVASAGAVDLVVDSAYCASRVSGLNWLEIFFIDFVALCSHPPPPRRIRCFTRGLSRPADRRQGGTFTDSCLDVAIVELNTGLADRLFVEPGTWTGCSVELRGVGAGRTDHVGIYSGSGVWFGRCMRPACQF